MAIESRYSRYIQLYLGYDIAGLRRDAITRICMFYEKERDNDDKANIGVITSVRFVEQKHNFMVRDRNDLLMG